MVFGHKFGLEDKRAPVFLRCRLVYSRGDFVRVLQYLSRRTMIEQKKYSSRNHKSNVSMTLVT